MIGRDISWQQLGKFSGLPLDLGLFGYEKIHVLRFVGQFCAHSSVHGTPTA